MNIKFFLGLQDFKT